MYDFRCPVCGVLFPLGDYVCLGGWPNSNPPSRVEPPHEPTRVVTVKN